MDQTASKSLMWFSLGSRAKIGVTKKLKKTKNHVKVILRPFAGTPLLALDFGVRDHIAELPNFCENRLRGFGVLMLPILPFSMGIN